MTGFVVRRVLAGFVTLLVSSFVVFAALYVAPGSPLALLTGGRSLPPSEIASISAQYHLNQPFLERYWHWLINVAHGNFGESLQFRQDVASLLGPRIVTTLMLVVYAGIVMMVLGIGSGVIASLRKGKVDTSILAVTSVGMATPVFVTSLLLVYVFAVKLGWFPASGAGTGFADKLYHLTLPAIALAFAGMAYISRVTRSAMNAELVQGHVDMARSRGIPEPLVVRRHVMRNALGPVTTVVGISIAALIAGDVVVEQAFSIGGLGSFLVAAVTGKDFAVVQAIMLILVLVFVVVNTIADVIVANLDPRIRLHQQRA